MSTQSTVRKTEQNASQSVQKKKKAKALTDGDTCPRRMNAFAHYGVFYHIKGSVSIEYTCMLPFYFPKCKRRRKFSCRQETAGVFFKMAAAICS